ncbi:MAG: metallophosphoesterase family protein [Chthoniobacteraceae bacterium]
MIPLQRIVASAALVGVALLAFSADENPPSGRGGKDGRAKGGKGGDAPVEDLASLFRTDVPAHSLDVVLGRPTKNSVTASVLAYADREGVIQFGPKAGAPVAKTAAFALKAGVPAEVALTGLQADTQYFYRLSTRAGIGAWTAEPEHSFRTQRAPGRTFTFTVQADPHLDDKVEPRLLERSLLNSLSDAPDFHIDLGDTFMTDKYRRRYELAAKQYVAQRHYFGLIGHSAPVFLVLGNHDGEMGGRRRDEDEAVWSNMMRKKYFANPFPDGFYTGNEYKHPKLGLLQDYYAWEWGDALFVALDPFWFSKKSRDDNWARSLGDAQYQWLRRTLEGSKAKFKFVFLHHLVGGATPEGRGGSEAAPFFEWGGRNLDGTDGFAAHRPGWPAPIHQLLVQNHVSIVFHGHDHIFAKQDLDGIVYQEVPQPGNPARGDPNAMPRTAAEYGYLSGKILGAPGYMRISVTPGKVTADLVRSYLPDEEGVGRRNHEVAFSYEIQPR